MVGGEIDPGFAGVEEEGGGGEGEGGEGGVAGVGGLGEEGGVAAEEAEDGDGEAEGLLERGEGAGGEEGGGGPPDGVLEEDGGLDVGVAVDYVVQPAGFYPFQTDFCQVADGLELGEEVKCCC